MGQNAGFLLVPLVMVIMQSMAFAQDNEAAENGRKMFIEKRCYTCHTINAEGDAIQKEKEAFAKSKGVDLKSDEEDDGDEKHKSKGGDLSDVGNERDQKWLTDFVKAPKKFFKSDAKCKKLAKKKYRKRFKGSDEDYEVLITYLTTLKYGDMQEEDIESCLIEE